MLEEMPPFQERESSILAKLKKKRPDKTGLITDRLPMASTTTTASSPSNIPLEQKREEPVSLVSAQFLFSNLFYFKQNEGS